MKAVRMHGYGGTEVLMYEEIPQPQPKAGEVLVRVAAASVNPVDWKMRQGYGKDWFGHTLPQLMGCDFAGVVETVGSGVSEFKPGDSVYAYVNLQRLGGYAEYAIATPSELALKPNSIDFVQAAALPVVALTAWQALFDTAHFEAGQKILIHAAAGGVGSIAVQLAKARGITVIGTASGNNLEFLRELGVDEAIDYQTTRFETVVQDLDGVFDTIGGETQARSPSVIKPGGFLISIVSPPPAQAGIQTAMLGVKPNGEQLGAIAQLVDAGQLRPIVETVLPLAEVRRAHELSQTGRTRGKIVLQVADLGVS